MVTATVVSSSAYVFEKDTFFFFCSFSFHGSVSEHCIHFLLLEQKRSVSFFKKKKTQKTEIYEKTANN